MNYLIGDCLCYAGPVEAVFRAALDRFVALEVAELGSLLRMNFVRAHARDDTRATYQRLAELKVIRSLGAQQT
jgi:hypothetical protein